MGKKTGVRYRIYERLQHYVKTQGSLLESDLDQAIDAVYKYPLRQSAIDLLRRKLQNKVTDESLVTTVVDLYHDDRLCIIHEHERQKEPKILCSLGLNAMETTPPALN
ncbi:hypothetical protein QUF74_01980 [Candidatus Halobeggiatoa sp. HSG11]|nr:hypothetical protein [Candidatus Halobeggiatoa sp. HSG11]